MEEIFSLLFPKPEFFSRYPDFFCEFQFHVARFPVFCLEVQFFFSVVQFFSRNIFFLFRGMRHFRAHFFLKSKKLFFSDSRKKIWFSSKRVSEWVISKVLHEKKSKYPLWSKSKIFCRFKLLNYKRGVHCTPEHIFKNPPIRIWHFLRTGLLQGFVYDFLVEIWVVIAFSISLLFQGVSGMCEG